MVSGHVASNETRTRGSAASGQFLLNRSTVEPQRDQQMELVVILDLTYGDLSRSCDFKLMESKAAG